MDMDQNDPALNAVLQLSLEERIQAVRTILKSIFQAEDAPLSDEMIQLLKERLEEYLNNPDAGEEWEAVRASLEAAS